MRLKQAFEARKPECIMGGAVIVRYGMMPTLR
jgi:hypothetical protein